MLAQFSFKNISIIPSSPLVLIVANARSCTWHQEVTELPLCVCALLDIQTQGIVLQCSVHMASLM